MGSEGDAASGQIQRLGRHIGRWYYRTGRVDHVGGHQGLDGA